MQFTTHTKIGTSLQIQYVSDNGRNLLVSTASQHVAPMSVYEYYKFIWMFVGIKFGRLVISLKRSTWHRNIKTLKPLPNCKQACEKNLRKYLHSTTGFQGDHESFLILNKTIKTIIHIQMYMHIFPRIITYLYENNYLTICRSTKASHFIRQILSLATISVLAYLEYDLVANFKVLQVENITLEAFE